jgi:hypothetical protein
MAPTEAPLDSSSGGRPPAGPRAEDHQMHGGLGVKVGTVVESLYREIRALRIYEGATEVQQLIVGRDVLGA